MAQNVALVLGGGGAAGNAWEIGVIAGLAEAGLDLTEAGDLVVGTSAGATAAAQVRGGIPPAGLLASVLSPPAQPVGQDRGRPPSLPMATVFERMRAIGAAATSAGSRPAACDGRVRVGGRPCSGARGGTPARRGRRQVASP
jgi:NTE family protein